MISGYQPLKIFRPTARDLFGHVAGNIVFMLSKEFIRLIFIAFIIATPFTYYAITRWLQNFAEHIVMSPFTFLFAGIAVLVIALLTVSYVSFMAAATNPTKALQNE